MSGWTMKRFWMVADVEPDGSGGFAVVLDGRRVKTPRREALVLPTATLARLVAAEWDAQSEKVDPTTMPLTRLANSAIDTVVPSFDAVADTISAYAETDLLCYRADSPRELTGRQSEVWDPYLDWLARTCGTRLQVTSGVLPVAQDPAILETLASFIRARSPFALAGLHELVTLTGSLVLGLAAAGGEFELDAVWAASRVDEDWQISQWGHDDEADAAAERKRAAFHDAGRFVAALGDHGLHSR